MAIDLDKIERVARAASEMSPGPWRMVSLGRGFVDTAQHCIDYIVDSTPKPDHEDGPWDGGQNVVVTDGGYYDPKGATAEHIATCSPDVVLEMVAELRELRRLTSLAYGDGA